MSLSNKTEVLIDRLIPRGGEKPNCIYVSLEDYLSRISNFNRKLHGTAHRLNAWSILCKEHKNRFDKVVNSNVSSEVFNDHNIQTFHYSTRDLRLENEFETLLYSIATTLSSLTRIVASFLKSSTQVHSHTTLPDTLSKYQDFKDSELIVKRAHELWVTELTQRRDAATHYIALTITSKLFQSKLESQPQNTVTRIGIPKNPEKYVSLWNDDLPTIGGSKHTTIKYDNGHEIHELRDVEERLIVKRVAPLQAEPELIDGEKYIDTTYNNFQEYLIEILDSLTSRIYKECS